MAGIIVKKLNTIGYAYPVESVSRKFALRKEKLGTVPYRGGTYAKMLNAFMGASVRKVRVDGALIDRNVFWVKKGYRNSPLTQREHQIRNAFTQGVAWVQEAMHDLGAITSNQMKWSESLHTGKKIKGCSARDYTYVQGWMNAIAIKIKLDGETLPANHILPDFDA